MQLSGAVSVGKCRLEGRTCCGAGAGGGAGAVDDARGFFVRGFLVRGFVPLAAAVAVLPRALYLAAPAGGGAATGSCS